MDLTRSQQKHTDPIYKACEAGDEEADVSCRIGIIRLRFHGFETAVQREIEGHGAKERHHEEEDGSYHRPCVRLQFLTFFLLFLLVTIAFHLNTDETSQATHGSHANH